MNQINSPEQDWPSHLFGGQWMRAVTKPYSSLNNGVMCGIDGLPYDLYNSILNQIPAIDRDYLSPIRIIFGGEGGGLSVTQALKRAYRRL